MSFVIYSINKLENRGLSPTKVRDPEVLKSLKRLSCQITGYEVSEDGKDYTIFLKNIKFDFSDQRIYDIFKDSGLNLEKEDESLKIYENETLLYQVLKQGRIIIPKKNIQRDFTSLDQVIKKLSSSNGLFFL